MRQLVYKENTEFLYKKNINLQLIFIFLYTHTFDTLCIYVVCRIDAIQYLISISTTSI